MAKQKVMTNVVVAGGGVAGMQAASTLSKLGHRVVLVHSGQALGGMAARMPELYGYVGADPDEATAGVNATVEELVRGVGAGKNITVLSGATLTAVEGEIGGFAVTALTAAGEQEIRAGAVVLASGCGVAASSAPGEAAASGGVVGMAGLVDLMRAKQAPKRIAIVMDLASEQGRAVSAQALSAAERLAKQHSVQVKLFCMNIRVAATGLEGLYRRARRAGVVVVKLDTQAIVCPSDAKPGVTYVDPVAGVQLTEEFDLVVTADAPAAGNSAERPVVVGLRAGQHGARQYDNIWLLTGYTNRPGVFVAGKARGNSEYRDALTDGLSVAWEVHQALGDGRIDVPRDTAAVDADKCVLCLTCVRVCPHGAIGINDSKKAASVSPLSCKRCGICAAECPAKAIKLPGFTDEQTDAAVGKKPRVTVFACENSAIPAADAVGRKAYGAEVQLVRVPCAGKVEPRSVLAALEKGAERVLILACHPESCKYLHGATRASRRVTRMSAMLEKAGVDKSRVFFGGLASVEPGRFLEYVSAKQIEAN